MVTLRKSQKANSGFTLLEVLVVMGILAILMAIAVPSVTGIIEKTKLEVCMVNRIQLEKSYEHELILQNKVYTDFLFSNYLRGYEGNLCPDHGEFSYVDGRVRCSIHTNEHESGDDSDEGDSVPYL